MADSWESSSKNRPSVVGAQRAARPIYGPRKGPALPSTPTSTRPAFSPEQSWADVARPKCVVRPKQCWVPPPIPSLRPPSPQVREQCLTVKTQSYPKSADGHIASSQDRTPTQHSHELRKTEPNEEEPQNLRQAYMQETERHHQQPQGRIQDSTKETPFGTMPKSGRRNTIPAPICIKTEEPHSVTGKNSWTPMPQTLDKTLHVKKEPKPQADYKKLYWQNQPKKYEKHYESQAGTRAEDHAHAPWIRTIDSETDSAITVDTSNNSELDSRQCEPATSTPDQQFDWDTEDDLLDENATEGTDLCNKGVGATQACTVKGKEMGNQSFNPAEFIRQNFHRFPEALQKEVRESPFGASIPLDYYFVSLTPGSYGLGTQRFGRFLHRNNPQLLKQFLLNDLAVIRNKPGISASVARSYFFQKDGIQNSTFPQTTGETSMATALAKTEGKGGVCNAKGKDSKGLKEKGEEGEQGKAKQGKNAKPEQSLIPHQKGVSQEEDKGGVTKEKGKDTKKKSSRLPQKSSKQDNCSEPTLETVVQAKGQCKQEKHFPKIRNNAEGESCSNPYKVFSLPPHFHPQEQGRQERGKQNVRDPRLGMNSGDKNREEYAQQSRCAGFDEKLQQPEADRTGAVKLHTKGGKENDAPETHTTLLTQEAEEDSNAQYNEKSVKRSKEHTLPLQEMAIPQNQDKKVTEMSDAKDLTNYWEIIEGTPTFRTGAIMSLQRQQKEKENEKNTTEATQNTMEGEQDQTKGTPEEEFQDVQNSQIQSTQQTNKQQRCGSQEEKAEVLREMVISHRPNNMTAQEITKMNAMATDHGFSHRSNFCKP